jgi:hypothetical protein
MTDRGHSGLTGKIALALSDPGMMGDDHSGLAIEEDRDAYCLVMQSIAASSDLSAAFLMHLAP